MKKLYLFIFLILIGGVTQIQPVQARTNKLLNGKKVLAPVSQTITFAPFTTTQTFGAADVTLTATASSGLAVILSSSNTNVATIVAGKLHIVGVGTATITASQPGDGINFNAAANVSQNLTVNAGAQAVISGLTATSIALQSADVTLPATSTYNPATYYNNPIVYTSSNPAVATIVNGRLRLLATGTTTITANQAGNGNFANAAQVTAFYTVTPPAAPVFTTSLAGKVVGGVDFDPAATVSATYFSTITYTSSNPAVAPIIANKVRPLAVTAAGTVTITAVVTYPVGTGGTATVTTPNTTLVIGAAPAPATLPLAITFTAPGTKALTDVDFVPAITTTCTLPIPFTITSSNPAVATIVNGNIHYIGQGTSVITVSQGGGAAGTATIPKDVSQTLTVGPPTLAITAPGAKLTNSIDFPLAITTTLTNTPAIFVSTTPALATIVNGNVHLTGVAGTAIIKASQQNNTTTTIAPATPLLPADATTSIVIGAPATPAITFTALGTRQYSTTEVATTTTSTLASPAITFTSSNTNVAIITSNSIATVSQISLGQNYKAGTYTNVPLTGGTGTGAAATIIVTASGQALVTVTNPGRSYNVGDILSFTPASIGSTTGSGFNISVATVSNNAVRFIGAPAAPNNTTLLTATQGGGVGGNATIPADVQQVLTVTPLSINFPTIGTKNYTAQDFNPSVSAASASTRLIYLTSSNPAVASIIATQAYALTSGGTLYTNGTYTNVPVIGGTGTGMLATIVVASGSVTATGTVITNPGINYTNGDILTVNASSVGGTGSGLILTLGAYTGLIRFNSTVPAAPNNTAVITASMGGGVNGTTTLAPDVSQTLTLINPVINFPALGTKQYASTDINPGATGALIGLPVTYTSSNPAVATIVNGYIHFTGAPAAPNNTTVITASQTPLPGVNIGTQTIPAPVSQTLTVTPPTITFAALGTRTLGNDFNAGASSTVTNVPIVYTSSNPAVATINVNGISGTSSTSFGTLYTKAGTYLNVPLIGGTGSGAQAIVIVTNFGSAVTTLSSGGSGYTVGDVLTFAASSVGGNTGTPASITVTAVNSLIHYVGAPAAPNNTTVITASQGGGATGTLTLPADVSQTLTVNAPVITFPILGTKQLSSVDFAPGASSTLSGVPIVYTSSNTAIATIATGGITSLISNGGNGYADGVYTNVALTGGTGTGAVATITAVGGTITAVTLTGNTSGYTVGNVLTAPNTSLGGAGFGFSVTVFNVGSFVHFVSAPASPNNTVTITASQGGGAAGTATLPADVSQVLTVTPATISFPTLGAKVFPGLDFVPGATSSVNGTITYTSSNPAVATIVSGNIHLVGAPASPNNTTVITASQGGGASGTATLPADVSQTLTVGTIPVVFSFPPLGTKVLTNVDILPGITSPYTSVGITLTSSNTNVATIVNGKVHMVAVGTATITASQGGGAAGTLTIPADLAQTITITAPTLTFPAIGSRPYSNIDFNPGATSSITNIPVTYTSSNTNVATVNTTLLLGNLNGGSGYKDGTYTNVALTGGTGTGARVTIVIAGGTVTTVTPTTTGTLYTPGDILSCQALAIGGVGNGFNITVTSFYSLVRILPNYPAAPNNTTTITASLGGGATGTNSLPADVSQVLTVVSPVLTFPALNAAGSRAYTNIDINPGATSTVNAPITYTSDNTAIATITSTGQIHLTSPLVAGTVNIKASQQGSNATTSAAATAVLPADVSVPLTITAATFTFPALGSKALSSLDIDPGATSTVPGLITYTSSAPAVASILNNKIHFLTTGTTTITAFQNGASIGSSPLTVTSATITFAALGSKPFNTTDLAPGATSTLTASPITYTSSNTAVATIVNGNIRFIAAGTTTIRATQQNTAAASANAAATATLPADVSQTLTVTAPAITFAALASRPFQIADLPLAATSTLTSLPITYTSSDPNVATILNGNVHFVGLGSTTITASQTAAAIAAGLPVPAEVSQTQVVTAPTLTFAALGSPKPYNSTDLAISVTAGYTSTLGNLSPVVLTSSDPNVATIVYSNGLPSLRYVGIGTCSITASQAGFGNIPAPAPVSQVFTVTPATIAITAPGAKTLASPDVALATTVTLAAATVPVTFTTSDPTVATAIGGTLHVVGIGTCVITASQITSANYAPIPATTVITVTAATTTTPVLSFTTALGTRQYTNNGDITPTVTAPLTTVPVTYTSSNPLVATIVNGLIHLSPPAIINGAVVYPNPNTTVITASQGGGPNGVAGLLPADVSQVLTVVPAGISFPPLGAQRFTTVDLNPGAVSSYTLLAPDNTALPITYTSSDPTVATIVNNQIHFTGVGSTVITASLGNVVVPDVSQTMIVLPGVITFPGTASRVLSTADVPPGAFSTIANLPITYTSSDNTVASIVNGNLHLNNVGVTTITATQAATGATAPFSQTQILTVTPPVLTFPATRTAAYTITDQDPGATSTINTLPITYTSSNPALVNIVNNKLHFNIVNQGAGYNNTAIITATQAAVGDYPAVTAAQTLTVTQGIVIPTPLLKYYGDPDFSPAVSSLGYNVAYSSATTTTATVVNNGNTIHILAPGTSVITATQAGDNNTAAAAAVTSTLTVAAAPMVISPQNITRLYGVENPIPYPLVYTGFKSASGTAPLDDSTKFTTQPLLVSVTSATAPTVNLLPQYGGFIPKTLPVGVYTLTYGGAASTFYTFLYGTGTLTVTPATQTLTFDPSTINKKFGDADFDPLARSTGDPVVYTSSNTAVATIVNGKVHIVGVGTATITASLSPTSGNFTGSASLSAPLVVGLGTQTITASNIPFLQRGSASYTVNASASSGLPVQLVSGDQIVATISGQTVKPLHIGTTTITVKQPGNAFYAAAPDVVLYLKVVDASGDPVKVSLALSPNSDGINDFLLIEGVQDFPGNHVSIISRNGSKVFDTDNYDNKANVFVGKSNSGDQLPAGTYFYRVDFNIGDQKNHITGYFVLKY